MAARCSWLSRTQLVEKMRDTPVEPAPCGYGLFKHEPVALLLYIERWLTAPVQLEDGTLEPREKGTPQGSVVSPG